MTNMKGKTKGTCSMFSGLFGKHSVVPLATNMRIYKKHDIVDIKGMGTVHKAIPHKCYHGNTGRSLQCHPACRWHCCKQANKGKMPAQRITVHMEQIKHFKSRESFQKHAKENDEKKKKVKEKGTWDQLTHQPDPPRKALYENQWEGAGAARIHSL